MQPYALRPLEADDLAAVVAIEQGCHRHPWSRHLFERELDNPVSRLSVAVCGSEIVGYLCVWMFRQLRDEGVTRVLLEVRASNQPAIQLYQRWGFQLSSQRKGYYQDGEDALLMHCDLSVSSS